MAAPLSSSPDGFVLVTRPRPQAERTAQQIAAMGLRPWIAPLLEIKPRPLPPALSRQAWQAVLLTSQAAAQALADLDADLPVLAVGAQTAHAARQAGFAMVRSADGDARDLARLVRATLQPQAGPLLHLAGQGADERLGHELAQAGFDYRRATAYAAQAQGFTAETIGLVLGGGLRAVLLFSPQTARLLAQEMQNHKIPANMQPAALALSPAVAQALGPWPAPVRVAARPHEAALLDLLRQ